MEDLIKIAKERFEAGNRVAYVPLAGDPDRTRNFAGMWIVKTKTGEVSYFGVRLVGRLLGQNVETISYPVDSVESAVKHGLIIWDAYKFDSF